MLSNDTKKIIDDARDTLVGQIPVPMMQCQQITLALTYKFMSDDDEQAVELGGQRHYFTGGLEKYGWDKIMSLRLDDTQRSELYRAGLSALQESDSMPAVFREIFKDAMVPYGDHRTLALFLNTMNGMEYDDSEKLGDAYEYLLKTAEAQADAGQFRTPRHIINFIVNIINPQKHEVIIDPACGTAGFLVSAYQHVKSQHELPGGGTTLSIPDLTRLSDNLNGYDISPEMTKLAMANMYLHTQDKNPNIVNYDTLTSTDHWNDYADVMLANPPFMTPKGGIRPHSRFRVAAKKAEVLFVDYIASHLNEHGRAGIIVPEGIIFQSQNAYRQLRRLLLDESLVAVISLPGGVFQPYSGVKTSILILDKVLAPKTDYVAFFKVDNDGYDLGSQRRPVGKDDLPAVADEINEYLRRLRAGASLDDFDPQTGLLADRDWIADDGYYNLSGERYRERELKTGAFPLVPMGSVCVINPRKSQLADRDPALAVSFVPMADLNGNQMAFQPRQQRVLSAVSGSYTYFGDNDVILAKVTPCFENGKAGIARGLLNGVGFGSSEFYVLRCSDQVLPEWIYCCVTHPNFRDSGIAQMTGTGGLQRVPRDFVHGFEIPLPPLEVQRELVGEIDGYQRVVDGARAVIDNWRPRIDVDPDWPVAGIADLVANVPHSFKAGPFGSSLKKDCYVPAGYKVYGQEQVIRGDATFGDYYIDQAKYRELESCKVGAGDVLISLVGTYGKTMIVPDEHEPGIINPRLVKITLDRQKMVPEFLAHLFTQDQTVSQMDSVSHGGTMNILSMQTLKRVRVPVPPVKTQKAIVAEIETEQALVSANRELVERMEQRIQDAIRRVWEG